MQPRRPGATLGEPLLEIPSSSQSPGQAQLLAGVRLRVTKELPREGPENTCLASPGGVGLKGERVPPATPREPTLFPQGLVVQAGLPSPSREHSRATSLLPSTTERGPSDCLMH